ncbi:translation initiation factor IF-2-like [Catharus ustulatus]|uniref:translation initiation factor IF-2-like n=1 Tax=Catharus ustulatus TaxID=91951 RepID=UPI00140AA66A|nr:translation initiation factor IF-2-like [Catharus ustulatus]
MGTPRRSPSPNPLSRETPAVPTPGTAQLVRPRALPEEGARRHRRGTCPAAAAQRAPQDEFGGASAPRTTWMSGERPGLPPGRASSTPGTAAPHGGPSRRRRARPGARSWGASLGRGRVNPVNDVQT